MSIYYELLERLRSSSDETYREFNSRIVATRKLCIGVRIPDVRALVKSLSPSDKLDYLAECKFDYFEDTLVYGLIIARFTCDEFFKYLPTYLAEVDSWAHIDTFVPDISFAKKHRDKLFDYIETHIYTDCGFALRFCIIALMDFFLEEKINFILKTLEKIDGKGYYNDMAIAWLLSVAFVKRKDETFEFLQRDALSAFTHNKAISKICESRRVPVDDKAAVKKLLRK